MRLGRKNKKYYKDLHQQAYDRLTGMQAFGESKKEAVKNGTDGQKIFSFNTYLEVFVNVVRDTPYRDVTKSDSNTRKNSD